MITPLSDEVLNRRSSPIDMDASAFRQAGHVLVDQIAAFLSAMPEGKVTPAPLPSELKAKLPAQLPGTGAETHALLKETWELLTQNSLFNGHPRFWGYITSSPSPIGMLADLMASAINSNCGAFVLSPMATEIEKQTVNWLGQLIGYPTGDGIVVSGGNMANLVGFLAARKAKAKWDIRQNGLGPRCGKWRIYASAETHTWISKAADLFGMGLDAIRWVPVDEHQRIDTKILEEKIAEDKKNDFVPFIIVGTAGAVGTGVVDDLHTLASISQKEDCWFHIDGAYGGFAAAIPELKEMFKGFELADSVAIDPHKWLYSPLEAGCTLVKDPHTLVDAFSFHPVYYNFEGEEEPQTNFYERGMQNSRGFRALKVWLSLRHIGFDAHIQLIREDIELAKRLFEILQKQNEIEVFTQHLSITTFRYVPLNGKRDPEFLNELNQTLLNKLQSGGEVFLSNAVINGNFLLRVCIVNFRTTLRDIQALANIVVREGRIVEKELSTTQGFIRI